MKIVRESELPGVSQASLARKYGVSTSRLVKNKHELTEALESGGNQRRKRMREGKEEDVGKALFLWFEQKTAQVAHLSGPVLKQKASDLARAQGSDFFPSDGWLSRWKVRHNVVFRKEHGKSRVLTYNRQLTGSVMSFRRFWARSAKTTFTMPTRRGYIFHHP